MSLKPITEPDTNNVSEKYWNDVLSSHGLSMNTGKPPLVWINRGTPKERKESVVKYIGTNQNLVGREEEKVRDESGRVTPEGHGPDA